MKRTLSFLLAGVVGAATAAFSLQGRPKPAAPRWEYQVATVTGDPEGQVSYVNRYGAQGWELVQVTSNGTNEFWIFKRPR
jgi:hypothetical protein